MGAAWHFRQVEVMNLKTGHVSRFAYDQWLEATHENPRAEVTLKEASLLGESEKVRSRPLMLTPLTDSGASLPHLLKCKSIFALLPT